MQVTILQIVSITKENKKVIHLWIKDCKVPLAALLVPAWFLLTFDSTDDYSSTCPECTGLCYPPLCNQCRCETTINLQINNNNNNNNRAINKQKQNRNRACINVDFIAEASFQLTVNPSSQQNEVKLQKYYMNFSSKFMC